MQVHPDVRALPVETRLLVADVAGRLAHPRLDVVRSDGVGAPHLAGEDHEVRRAQRLARDARAGVGGEIHVDDGIGDPVADLVRMTLRDRLAREQMTCHVSLPVGVRGK